MGTFSEPTIPPPCFTFMNAELLEAQGGHSKLRFAPSASMENPFGVIQGGILAGMLDDVLGPAGMTMAGGRAFSTIQMSVNYLGRAYAGQPLLGVGHVIKAGKTQMLIEAELMRESDGEVLASAVSVNLFMDTYCQ
ncbi:MAG: PaaI family thioesterase [Myxococcota bacterium]|jgi:uncharacterized protein (TIGR00369 family)